MPFYLGPDGPEGPGGPGLLGGPGGPEGPVGWWWGPGRGGPSIGSLEKINMFFLKKIFFYLGEGETYRIAVVVDLELYVGIV